MAVRPLIFDIVDEEEDLLGSPGREPSPTQPERRGPVKTSFGRALRGEELDPAEFARDIGLQALGFVSPAGSVVSGFLSLADFLGLRGVVGGPLGGTNAPDISDQDVQRALEMDALSRGAPRATDHLSGLAPDPNPDSKDSAGPGGGIGGGVGGGGPGPGATGGVEGGGMGSEGSGGQSSGPSGPDFAKGGVIVVTKRMLHGPDPKGPDQGRISFNVQAGEVIIVIPREAVKRHDPDTFKAFFEDITGATAEEAEKSAKGGGNASDPSDTSGGPTAGGVRPGA